MNRWLSIFAVSTLLFVPLKLSADDKKVPAGKETLTLDSMSKAREAAGKKPLKGPVPFAHQAHVDKGVACLDCHHKDKAGEAPQKCSSCHKDTKGDAPKMNAAFHGGEGDGLPSLQSCIGCHARKGKIGSPAPAKREPCDACHSILKK